MEKQYIPKVSDYIDSNHDWIYKLRGNPKGQEDGKERAPLRAIEKYGPCNWCGRDTPGGDHPRWYHDPIEWALDHELIVCRSCYQAVWNIRAENMEVQEKLVAMGWNPQGHPSEGEAEAGDELKGDKEGGEEVKVEAETEEIETEDLLDYYDIEFHIEESTVSFYNRSPVKQESTEFRKRKGSETNEKNKKSNATDTDPIACIRCGVTETPLWRSDSSGLKRLCNACGLSLKRAKARKKKKGNSNNTWYSRQSDIYTASTRSDIFTTSSRRKNPKRRATRDFVFIDDKEFFLSSDEEYEEPISNVASKNHENVMVADESLFELSCTAQEVQATLPQVFSELRRAKEEIKALTTELSQLKDANKELLQVTEEKKVLTEQLHKLTQENNAIMEELLKVKEENKELHEVIKEKNEKMKRLLSEAKDLL